MSAWAFLNQKKIRESCPDHEAEFDLALSDCRWRDLRHTFASRSVMARVPLQAVQVLMGHKCIETTLRYSHLGETELHKAVERLIANTTDTTSIRWRKRASRSFGINAFE
jgi:site-specific recombinase XerD